MVRQHLGLKNIVYFLNFIINKKSKLKYYDIINGNYRFIRTSNAWYC